jgi:hypothetical protein
MPTDFLPQDRARPEQWVRFHGHILRRERDEVTLEPTIDHGAHLVVHARDVRQDGQEISIRPGSRYLRLDIVDRATYLALPLGQSTAACPQGSECIGNVRYCCGSGNVAGTCNGNYRCPEDN